MTLDSLDPVFLGSGPDAIDPLFGLPIMNRVQVTPDGVLDIPDDGADNGGLIVGGQFEEPLSENVSRYHGFTSFHC
jgi:hypothetical protein